MDKMVINQLPMSTLRGQRVFVRLDAYQEGSSSGIIYDESKLRASLPTLEYLMGVGARIIIGTHLGHPGSEMTEAPKLDRVAGQLTALLAQPVRKLDAAIGPEVLRAVANMKGGEVLMLENLYFYPGEEVNDLAFAHDLSKVCDVYCNDAFTLAHRGMASTVGITRHVRPAAVGLGMARELLMFEAVLDKPEPPFVALLAGRRSEEKIPVLEHLLPRVNHLCIGGDLACTFLKAKGYEVGAARVDDAFLPFAQEFLRLAGNDTEIVLPDDFIVVPDDQFRLYEKNGRTGPMPTWRRVLADELQGGDLTVDVGPTTVARIKDLFEIGRTIFWNGPLGMWEIEPFGVATCEVARFMTERILPRAQRSILCGDSLASAIRTFNLPMERIRHLTPGGVSALHLLAGKPLPAVEALDNAVDLVAPVDMPLRRIVLPVDDSTQAVDVATRLGQLVDAKHALISLLYVQKPGALPSEPTWSDADRSRRYEIKQRLEAERIFAAINAALAKHGLTSHGQCLVEGDPAEEILKLATETSADLIAMGAHRRTSIQRFFLGSVSRQVLDRSTCPVLIVRM